MKVVPSTLVILGIAAILAVLLVLTRMSVPTPVGNPAAQKELEAQGFPSPRFPKFVVAPTKPQLIAAARAAVRQTQGRAPLGTIPRGQTIHVFMNYSQDLEVWDAVREAWAERGVTALPVWS